MSKKKTKDIQSKVIDNSEVVLNAYVNEWKMLNQYINDIDKGYAQNIAILVTIATVAITISSVADAGLKEDLSFLFFVVPLAFLVCFGFLSYQFRITAILRGHLAYIEKEMNDLLGVDVYMWNSSLVETYMARRNVPNGFLLVPIMLVVLGLIVYCFLGTMTIVSEGERVCFVIVYWLVVLSIGVVILVTFFNNEKIRYETYCTESVLEKYIEAALLQEKEIKKCVVKLGEVNSISKRRIFVKCILKKKYREADRTVIIRKMNSIVGRMCPATCEIPIIVNFVACL